MDFSKSKPSKRLEDRTAPDPFVRWLASLASSKSRLTEEELEMLSGGGVTVNDLYFRRALQGDSDTYLNPDFAKRQRPLFK